MLRLIERPAHQVELRVPASERAVVSWNTPAPAGGIALIAHRCDGSVSEPLLFARWSPSERRSFDASDGVSQVEVDVLHSAIPLQAIGVSSTVELDAVAVSVPPPPGASVPRHDRTEQLDVPRISQYLPGHPAERGWCSAASLAMLLRYHGVAVDVPDVVHGVFDTAYGGTGNWAFSMAYAGAHGLRGAVAYLRGIDHVAMFLAAGLPVAISIGWKPGELPGAPLEQSAGHLLVVRGINRGHVLVNDPAHPAVIAAYPRAKLDDVFRAHGCVAYLVAPRERTAELVALANNEPAATAH